MKYFSLSEPFYQPQVVPKPIVVHEVVGLPIVRDKHGKHFIITCTLNYILQACANTEYNHKP